MNRLTTSLLFCALVSVPSAALAQGTVADYKRAMGLREKYQNTVPNITDQARWLENTNRLVYRKTVKAPSTGSGQGAYEFVVVDADAGTKKTPFDHEKLAAALSTAAGQKYTAVTLPFNTFNFVDGDRAIQFTIGPAGAGRGVPGCPRTPGAATSRPTRARSRRAADAGRGRGAGGGLAGPVRPPFDINGADPRRSPDGKMEALVSNYNVAVRPVGSRATHAAQHRRLRGGLLRSGLARLVA